MAFIIGTPYAKNAGYFKNDNRSSDGQLEEADIKTCPHCQAVIKLNKLEGDLCNKCNAPVCEHCASRMDLYGCENFLRQIERSVKLASSSQYQDFLQQAGLVPPVPPKPIFTGLISERK